MRTKWLFFSEHTSKLKYERERKKERKKDRKKKKIEKDKFFSPEFLKI